jgi:hypothetical protein
MTCSEREFERIIAVLARIEFLAGGTVCIAQPAGVVDGDMIARLGFGAFADDLVFVLESGCGH